MCLLADMREWPVPLFTKTHSQLQISLPQVNSDVGKLIHTAALEVPSLQLVFFFCLTIHLGESLNMPRDLRTAQ